MAAVQSVQTTKEHAYQYVDQGMVLVPLRPQSKAPYKREWNRPENLLSTREDVDTHLGPMDNIGLALGPSRIISLDIDNLTRAREIFAESGIDLDQMLRDPRSVGIDSGRTNRAKLLFRQHPDATNLTTVDFDEPDGKVYEIRCLAKNGNTMQDVLPPSIHPDTGQPYEAVGNLCDPPMLPAPLRAFWEQRQAEARQPRRVHPSTLIVSSPASPPAGAPNVAIIDLRVSIIVEMLQCL